MLTANILHTLLDQGQSAPLCFRTPPASRIDLRYWLRADVVPCSTFKRSDLTPRSLQGHEDAFPRPRLSARCRFSQGTFAGTRGNGRDALSGRCYPYSLALAHERMRLRGETNYRRPVKFNK